jgi:hypothetical protein
MSETESLDNSNSIAHIIETGDLEEARSILGDREKIRYAGIIRAGVKIPKNSCTAEEKKKFLELEAQGLPYDEIDRQIGGEPKTAKSKLFPTNVDNFVIRDCDFRRPSDAAYIREHFKDTDGKVRRLPVWLATDVLDQVIPHNFRAFGGDGSLRCVSFYDGDDLKFKYIKKGVTNPKTEDWQILDSDDEDAATKACGYKVQFGGLYKVNIPGLRGLGEILVPTRSWYGMGDAYAQLKKVRQLLGRFNGLLNGEPFLELCKVQETVKDPSGKKVKQWLITIELAVDPMELARHAENTLTRGRAALSLFNSQPAAAAYAAAHVTPAVATETEQKPAEETKKTDTTEDLAEVIEKAHAAIASVGKWGKLTDKEVEACYLVYGGKTKAETTTKDELMFVYQSLRKALKEETGPADVKAACKKAIKAQAERAQSEGPQGDPEIEAMIQEILNLAENADLDPEHIKAHLIAITGGIMPEDQGLEELQQAYREIEARINGDKEVFIEEIAQDFAMNGG